MSKTIISGSADFNESPDESGESGGAIDASVVPGESESREASASKSGDATVVSGESESGGTSASICSPLQFSQSHKH